jgi:uncharacterized protein YdeI (YjbR/CyaY-like superfamily)
MSKSDLETFCPANRAEWRRWLQENHLSKQSIWMIYYKKNSANSSLTWSEAVDEALCFGWIDSTRRGLDEESFMQYFCKRKPKSNWSKINKNKIDQLTSAGLMFPAGLQVIDRAKLDGSWNKSDEIEQDEIPADLLKELTSIPNAHTYFLSLSKSVRKSILNWLAQAKRPETRTKRIQEITQEASQNKKPKQF